MSASSRLSLLAVCAVSVLTGCGGGSSRKSSSTAGAPPPTASSATTTTQTAASSKPKSKPRRTTPTATTPAPGPGPAKPPASSGPDGLRVPTGYATSYTNCQGSCGGAVPQSLRRQLHLPSGGCPVSASHGIAGSTVLGGGAVGPIQPQRLAINSFINSSWSGGRVTWISAASYSGPLLIRGRALGAAHAVGFGEGNVPVDELQLLSSAVPTPGGARQWPTFTRVRGPGCYAYQVDGTSFSDVIVFRAA